MCIKYNQMCCYHNVVMQVLFCSYHNTHLCVDNTVVNTLVLITVKQLSVHSCTSELRFAISKP